MIHVWPQTLRREAARSHSQLFLPSYRLHGMNEKEQTEKVLEHLEKNSNKKNI